MIEYWDRIRTVDVADFRWDFKGESLYFNMITNKKQ